MSLLLLFTPLEGIEVADPRLLILVPTVPTSLTLATTADTALTLATTSDTSLTLTPHPLP
jgi:hypothetical protein